MIGADPAFDAAHPSGHILFRSTRGGYLDSVILTEAAGKDGKMRKNEIATPRMVTLCAPARPIWRRPGSFCKTIDSIPRSIGDNLSTVQVRHDICRWCNRIRAEQGPGPTQQRPHLVELLLHGDLGHHRIGDRADEFR